MQDTQRRSLRALAEHALLFGPHEGTRFLFLPSLRGVHNVGPKMKDFRHLLLLSLLVFPSAATLTYAAAATAIEVVVSSSAGEIFYK